MLQNYSECNNDCDYFNHLIQTETANLKLSNC